MSNSAAAKASREEEIAFLMMEQVLGVDIRLADAGGGNKMPDGVWLINRGRDRSIVEVTSPPAKKLMAEWADAKRKGRQQTESGTNPAFFGQLSDLCAEFLATTWARENIEKLRVRQAVERHLFLFGRGYDVQHFFYRLADSCTGESTEPVGDLALPEGITDVWFMGRAQREPSGQLLGTADVRLARYQAGTGWQGYVAKIDELDLPSPNGRISDDPVPGTMRHPKDRTAPRCLIDGLEWPA